MDGSTQPEGSLKSNTEDPAYQKQITGDHGETKRAVRRREKLQLRSLRPGTNDQWGLALSGGGIRSATFCLGVLQALSQIRAADIPPPDANQTSPEVEPHDNLLAQFDYLSTVSGGGYIGSFFGSLFVPNRLSPGTRSTQGSPDAGGTHESPPADKDAAYKASEVAALKVAQEAYQVFACDPPPRMREGLVGEHNTPQGRAKIAMAWLRENGRYLSPTSAGDTLYGAATAIRAWFGMQYVLGSLLVSLFLLLSLTKFAYGWLWLHFAGDSAGVSSLSGLIPQLLSFDLGTALWWSPLWDLVAVLVTGWIAPCILAFWLTYPRDNDKADWRIAISLACLITLLGVTVDRVAAQYGAQWKNLGHVADVATGLMGLAIIWWVVIFFTCKGNIGNQRVTLTRCLTSGLRWSGAVSFIAGIDTITQWLYMTPALRLHLLSQLTLSGVLTWLVHTAQNLIKEGTSRPKLKLPVDLLFAILGLVLATCLCGLWDMAVLWLIWGGSTPVIDALPREFSVHMPLAALGFACALVLLLVVGRYPQFLNLSTLSGLYGNRLARAYLGASNGKRFQGGSAAARSSAEPDPGDHILYEDYTVNQLAPMHLINICLNQNVDPSEQLVQRDRKGRPLVVLPGMHDRNDSRPVIAVDGKLLEPGANLPIRSERLTIDEWIAVSGAAVSSGMGRGTTAAKAFLLGIANVRLGRWWQSGIEPQEKERNRWSRLARLWFPTQVYLVEELTAHFHGLRRRLHYLSDGGHFDNTGIYELLRAERNIKLIVACDCGADPEYLYHDLGVLIRLARIDFGLDLRLADDTETQTLGEAFGSFQTVGKSEHPSDRCALLLNGYRQRTSPRDLPDLRIVILKPVGITSMPGDLRDHAADQPQFPQQTTADQYFDEAQWESYRKLGALIANRVLGTNQPHAKTVWSTLLKTVPCQMVA